MAYVNEPIAVIGSGCRFPGGSNSPSKLWDLMKSPRDVASKIDRFSAEGFYHKDGSHHGTSNVLHSYQIEEDTREFDAQFFSIPGSEAEGIDPQQRILMEVVYEALEASGHKIEELSGSSTGMYVGVMCNDYAHITYHDLESIPKYAATGTASSILSNRVSYFFNWTGPSMTIDTACSSSLIATHQAVELLRKGESNLAVAAGANLIFGPTNFVAESNVNMLSPTGRSRMWDNKADGYARGEGVAAVILKRLSDAIRDGDTIDCVIRETGVNQDGRTTGITMPSSVAQAELIRQTYARAGLNPHTDRCQYFEAHGTGTKAGDPQEAGAIYRAFFEGNENQDPNDKLYVGSIKTIIGHTEGTAGIAGLLRASLGMKHGFIPPNMLFEELNPDIEPYYGRLEILKAAKPWPKLPAGVPRRASVNSFGFGGANAHAIIESYEPETAIQTVTRGSTAAVPFLFSANSEKSLVSQIETFLSYSEDLDEETTNLRDLAWTLSRRSAFPMRAPFSALDLETLRTKLTAALEAKKTDGTALGVRPSHKANTILGIFTGQGAQWPRMGYQLVESSPFAASILKSLDESLQSLPEQDRPSWSLQDELAKSADGSRVMEGTYSQPLCAAVQIILVELLKQAGITFDVVVGHSSGEIGAAFAAGFLTARDAIRIAFYRGLFGKLAGAPNGSTGTMLAVGTSMEDADELCKLSTMKRFGKFNVAASNSSSSVTMSGDLSAIERAKFIFEDESKFVRSLKVDTAYHSHHMIPCSDPYMDAMSRVKVAIQEPNPNCKWYSSVLGGDLVTSDMNEQLAGSYWKDNLLQPVLFSQALESALEKNGAPAMALEVGPHPALKGPASMVIEEALSTTIPYFGVLGRKSNDVEAFTDAVGAVWANVGGADVAFGPLDAAFASNDSADKPEFLRTMPGYTWDHSQTFWAESRVSKSMRMRQHGHHELLGVRMDSGENEMRWRNFLKPTEITWTRGHSIQGQTIFPGAGFASMAIEAAKEYVNDLGETMDLVELENLRIHWALGFLDETIGSEITVTICNIQRDESADMINCDFVCSACPTKDAALTTISTAHLKLTLGYGSADTLPSRPPPNEADKMTDLDPDVFYDSLAKLGYNYADMFKTITSLNRRKLASTGVLHTATEEDYKTNLIVHPAPLDVAFQGLFAAIGSPGDGQLWTLMVPTIIRSIKVNPFTCNQTGCLDKDLSFEANVQVERSNQQVGGDIDLYDDAGNAMIQIEGLQVTPVTQITARDDAQKFSDTHWGNEKADATRAYTEFWNSESEKASWEESHFVERTCFYYMKQLHDAIKPEEIEGLEVQAKKYLTWVASVVEKVSAGSHPTIKKEWLNDTYEKLEGPMSEFAQENEELLHLMTLGDQLIPFIRGEVSLVELFDDFEVIDRIYQTGYGMPQFHSFFGDLVEQLTFKARQMDILEVGAGSGSATEAIMSRIDYHYGSYTYTDVSASFFPEAQELFKDQEGKIVFRTLDMEEDVVEQGFSERSYDLIVASNVLHVSKNIEETLKNLRKLLKPAGHIVLLEVTDLDHVRSSFYAGSKPGWWAAEDGREPQPLLPQSGWNALLKKTGFSGIETATPETHMFTVPYSVMLSQAVDSQIQLLREPLSPENRDSIKLPKLLVIAGQTEATAKIQDEVLAILEPFNSEVEIVARIEDLTESHFGAKQLVLNLMELDTNLFGPLTAERWSALQTLTENSQNILWLTHGVGAENPYANMIVGTSRALVHEKPDLKIQVIDFADGETIDTKLIASELVKLHIAAVWRTWSQPYVTTWVLEREIRFVGGKATVPRVGPCKPLDARYNASRRKIYEEVDLKSAVVAVSSKNGVCDVKQVRKPFWAVTEPGLIEVEVSRSTLAPLAIPSLGSLHLVVGQIVGTEQTVLAFSETLESKIALPQDLTLSVDVSLDQAQELLVSVASYLLGDYLLSQSAKGKSVMVHEPTPALAAALKDLAQERSTALSLTTSSPSEELQYIHPRAHRRTIVAAFPAKLSTYVNFPSAHDSSKSGEHIEKYLPSYVKRVSPNDFLGEQAYLQQQAKPEAAIELLQKGQAFFEAHSDLETTERVQQVSLEEAPGFERDQANATLEVLNFADQSVAFGALCPPEDDVEFRSDKTYWLAGLTGELGLSLTRWMVERGARYIVLTSRNPKVSDKWIDSVQSTGAVVKCLPMDITNAESVMKTYAHITSEFPPIAGVCNGAMVLNDGVLANQSFEDFNATLTPKVKGTQFLDSLFQKNDLDFFIIFSSLSFVTGNIGQSSYAAANSFMVSVAEGRRKKGLAGSVMNLAGIFGIGYITRRDVKLLDHLAKMGYENISEWDYLQFFAEAVKAGKPETSAQYPTWEIHSAIRPVDSDAKNPPPWLEVPRFSWYRRVRASASQEGEGGATSVRDQLKDQTTMEGVNKALMAGFVAVLYKLLGMRPEDGVISPSTPLIELGIDSLVAVDMRVWFSRELDLDLPVLKLLGGATVEDMVEDAVSRLSPDLIPNVQEAQASAEGAEGAEAEAKAEDSESQSSGEIATSTETTPPASEAGINDTKTQ
ncbi:polyketide synthase [Penicillium verhagenii]|uniref:polyketide synthase n=1 Tax=Penicillium verhagenii TaxID=1562060 RepID=UPI00254580E9|nr:polyketide synthase [Penicillium verhagenii]KAJ5948184.1 polyketide synthase [Penicillium verhagenii]